MGPETGKARPPTVDSFTDGTSRRLVRAVVVVTYGTWCGVVAVVAVANCRPRSDGTGSV